MYYFDHRQRPAYRSYTVSYAIASSLDEASVASMARRAIESLDPQVPFEVRPLAAIVGESVADRRFTMLLLGNFAAIAVMLAVVGIYAVVSYTVAQRTREMGVRLALGSSPGRIRWLVLSSSLRAVIPGLVAGVLLAMAGSGALRSLLYGVSPFDAGTHHELAAASSQLVQERERDVARGICEHRSRGNEHVQETGE